MFKSKARITAIGSYVPELDDEEAEEGAENEKDYILDLYRQTRDHP